MFLRTAGVFGAAISSSCTWLPFVATSLLVSIANLPTFFIQSSVKVPPTWPSGALRRGTDVPSRHGMLVLSPSSGLTIDSELVRLLRTLFRAFLLSGRPWDAALGRITWFLGGACGWGAPSPCYGGPREGRLIASFFCRRNMSKASRHTRCIR